MFTIKPNIIEEKIILAQNNLLLLPFFASVRTPIDVSIKLTSNFIFVNRIYPLLMAFSHEI